MHCNIGLQEGRVSQGRAEKGFLAIWFYRLSLPAPSACGKLLERKLLQKDGEGESQYSSHSKHARRQNSSYLKLKAGFLCMKGAVYCNLDRDCKVLR